MKDFLTAVSCKMWCWRRKVGGPARDEVKPKRFLFPLPTRRRCPETSPTNNNPHIGSVVEAGPVRVTDSVSSRRLQEKFLPRGKEEEALANLQEDQRLLILERALQLSISHYVHLQEENALLREQLQRTRQSPQYFPFSYSKCLETAV